jgi:putative FmdB family regulatory protein
MPTYDYECKACHHRWELFQSIKAEPEKKCPKCGKRQAQRMIGAGAGIIFKGSGFYQTDYRSSGYKKAAEADKKASEGTSAKSNGEKSDSGSAKSESKSAESKSTAESKSSSEKSGGAKSRGGKSGGSKENS